MGNSDGIPTAINWRPEVDGGIDINSYRKYTGELLGVLIALTEGEGLKASSGEFKNPGTRVTDSY